MGIKEEPTAMEEKKKKEEAVVEFCNENTTLCTENDNYNVMTDFHASEFARENKKILSFIYDNEKKKSKKNYYTFIKNLKDDKGKLRMHASLFEHSKMKEAVETMEVRKESIVGAHIIQICYNNGGCISAKKGADVTVVGPVNENLWDRDLDDLYCPTTKKKLETRYGTVTKKVNSQELVTGETHRQVLDTIAKERIEFGFCDNCRRFANNVFKNLGGKTSCICGSRRSEITRENTKDTQNQKAKKTVKRRRRMNRYRRIRKI